MQKYKRKSESPKVGKSESPKVRKMGSRKSEVGMSIAESGSRIPIAVGTEVRKMVTNFGEVISNIEHRMLTPWLSGDEVQTSIFEIHYSLLIRRAFLH